MEILAALGYGAREIFSYNRENFKFDQDQRIERETLRLEMQVKRFELFREDVRDLTELTVGRMDVYHLVGSLFLQFCVVLFCQGRVQTSAPPFLLSLFLLSNACAFIYLLLAVWLSMHASIASHSFGVRLLTRFIRLPIPSMRQMNALRNKYTDFEHQGLGNLLRLPFMDKKAQEWHHPEESASPPVSSSKVDKQEFMHKEGAQELLSPRSRARSPEPFRESSSSSSSRPPKPHHAPRSNGARTPSPPVKDTKLANSQPSPEAQILGKSQTQLPRRGSRSQLLEDGTRKSQLHEPKHEKAGVGSSEHQLLPEEAESPLAGDDLLAGTQGALPERHIQLFRQLQSKWQCYDAYCRVCMGLGVNQILQALSYYSACHTLVENHSPTTGFAMILLFQCTTVALAVLDLAGLHIREIFAIQVVGMMPCFVTAWEVAHGARNAEGVLDPEEIYPLSPFSFIFQVLWLELWLRVAAPTSEDTTQLPRRFRQVLFLDVFGDADDGGQGGSVRDVFPRAEDEEADDELSDTAQRAASCLALAQWAIRRWTAAPDWAMSRYQVRELNQLRKQLMSWGGAVRTELFRCGQLRGLSLPTGVLEEEFRSWHNFTPEVRKAGDLFAHCLVGPFQHDNGDKMVAYHYQLETQKTFFEDDPSGPSPGVRVLTLEALASTLGELEKEARCLLELRIMRDLRVEMRRQQAIARARRRKRKLRRAQSIARIKKTFPNLVTMAKQRLAPKSDRRDREDSLELMAQRHDADCDIVHDDDGQPESPQRPDRDQTLEAMAGENAHHFVPERLPWMVVRGTTRVLQFCWLMSGLMALLKEANVYQVDFQQHPAAAPERRLGHRNSLVFQPVDVLWPEGPFFLAEALFCPNSGRDDLLIASPYALFSASAKMSTTWSLEELRRIERMPGETVVMCSKGARESFNGTDSVPWLRLAPWNAGIAVWPASGSLAVSNPRILPLSGQKWRLLAGATMPCYRLNGLLLHPQNPKLFCLVLAGWDGSMLPVAVVPLTGEQCTLPNHGVEVNPIVDIPLTKAEGADGVVTMHIEPKQGWLWISMKSGEIQAWDLVGLHPVGRWRPRWKHNFCKALLSTDGLCINYEDRTVYAVGRCNSASGAILWQGNIPTGLGITRQVSDVGVEDTMLNN